MKLTGGSVIIEMETVEAKTLLKILGALSINNCEEICDMTGDEIKISDDIYKSLKDYFGEVL